MIQTAHVSIAQQQAYYKLAEDIDLVKRANIPMWVNGKLNPKAIELLAKLRERRN